MTDYASIMQLWNDVGIAEAEHECVQEEFYRCDICEASNQAWHRLEHSTRELLELLESHHGALKELVKAWVEDVPAGRTGALETALVKAQAVLGERCK